MHRLLRGYYGIGPDAFSALAETALIVPDTNVLLNLYRVGDKTQNDLYSLLEWAGDRLWIPFTVALEFQRNRQKVRADAVAFLEDVSAKLIGALDAVKLKLDYIRPRESRDELQVALQSVEDSSQKFLKIIKDISAAHMPSSPDLVRQRLDKILSAHIGEPLTKEEVAEAVKEAQERFKAKVPPGYEDSDKKHTVQLGHLSYEAKYGDFLLWHEIRRRLRQGPQKSVILLSDDQKEDWWQRESGKTIGPRPELFAELIQYADATDFAMYTTENFLRLAKENSLLSVAQETIADIAELAPSGPVLVESKIIEGIANLLRGLGYRVMYGGTQGPDLRMVKVEGTGEPSMLGIEVTLLCGLRHAQVAKQRLMAACEQAAIWIKRGVANRVMLCAVIDEGNATPIGDIDPAGIIGSATDIGIAIFTLSSVDHSTLHLISEFGSISLTVPQNVENENVMSEIRSALTKDPKASVELTFESPQASSDPDVAREMALSRAARIRAGFRVVKLYKVDEHGDREPVLEALVNAEQARELIALGAIWVGPMSRNPAVEALF